MQSNTHFLKNNRGEGHVDTGVKIIIAVVIGALILGGFYVLFATVVLPKMNGSIQEMMHYEEDAASFRHDAFDSKLTSLEYSYDGTTWQKSSIPELGENAVIKKMLKTSEEGFNLALVNDDDTIYIIMSEDNGIHWSVARNIGKLSLADKRVEYSLNQYANGTYGMMVRTYDGRTSTSGWGYQYKSSDGRNWYKDNLGIDFF